jgi:hypothetical protein
MNRLEFSELATRGDAVTHREFVRLAAATGLEVGAGLLPTQERSYSTLTRIESSDQWGVELDKQSAQRMIPELENKEEPALVHDRSTNILINH